MGADGMCPFRDKKAICMWPIIFVLMNLPENMRYDPRNIIILYIGTSATQGAPLNFPVQLEPVTRQLIRAANGFDLQVGAFGKMRVHLIAPIISCDGRGHQCTCTGVAGLGGDGGGDIYLCTYVRVCTGSPDSFVVEHRRAQGERAF